MTHGLPDVAQQDKFLAILTLDDWVVIYRLAQAADAIGVVPQEQLATELEQHGIFAFCRSLAQRIVATEFGLDPGAQLHEAHDHTFNLTAHLQQGLLNALTPSIMLVVS
jgi:hypothetical protein